MLFRKIRKTLEINRIKIEFPGKKIYYDRMTLWLSLALYAGMITLSIIFYSINGIWEWLVIIPLCLLFVPEKIRKLLFRNPVFIFQKDKFYYSLEDSWFDKTNSIISYKSNIGTDFTGTVTISDLKEYIIIEEDVFYLEDATEFRKEINQYSSNKSLLTFIEEQYRK